MKIHDIVYNFKTKHKEGFVQSDLDELLKQFQNIDMVSFNDAMAGNTCLLKDNEVIMYRGDIEKAIICGIEKRKLRWYEWD